MFARWSGCRIFFQQDDSRFSLRPFLLLAFPIIFGGESLKSIYKSKDVEKILKDADSDGDSLPLDLWSGGYRFPGVAWGSLKNNVLGLPAISFLESQSFVAITIGVNFH